MNREELTEHNARQRALFDREVEAFDRPQPPEVLDRLARVVGFARIPPGATVLDAGAGVGVLAPFILAFRPRRIYACDLSEAMLARLSRKHPFVRTIQCDVADLGLSAGSLDVAFLNAMYSNVGDKPRTHRNLTRMLRPGGRLVISHPEGRGFVTELAARSAIHHDPYPPYSELASVLRATGFVTLLYLDLPQLFCVVAERQPVSPGRHTGG